MKRVFGKVEAIFDVLYLIIALIIGIFLILSSAGNTIRLLAGIMALTLSIGDAFHLVPRILSIITNKIELFRYSLGRGKQITSITMTVFYILLWHIGISIYTLNNIEFITYIIYFLSFVRILLCLLPQNRWIDRYPPVILSIITNKIELFRYSLGRGKQITSITMTVFYILLWHIGISIYTLNNIEFITYIIYFLSFIRIILCLLPQNKWIDRYPPVIWGIWRNIPFFLLGILIAVIFYINRLNSTNFGFAWLAILFSFTFYLPVVLWSNKNPKIGMLMLPKTLMYLWILIMCLSI